MDTKRLITGMAMAMVLIGGWYLARSYIDRVHPEYARELADATTQPIGSTTPAPASQSLASGPTTAATSAPATSPTALHPVGGGESRLVYLGSGVEQKDPKYVMQVVLTSQGAGIQKVTLNQFRQSVKSPALYSFQEPYENHPESEALATRTLTVDGVEVNTDTGWKLDHSDESAATFTEDFVADSRPVARLTKTYHLPDAQSTAKTSKGYELKVDCTIENLANHPITVSTAFNGPTMPPKEVERGADQQVLVGYKAPASAIKVVQHIADEFKGSKLSQDLTRNGDDPAAWAGAASVYFNALVLPDTFSPDVTKTDYTINAENVNPDSQTPSDIAMTFTTGQIKLEVAGKASLPLDVFFGPKDRSLLTNPYYASFPRLYDQTLVIASGFCGVCTFAWLINILVNMLTFFHWIFRDWGIAIICLVAIVRALLHPITKKSQVHMMKMGKMGPEMERLKKKYGDDKEALNKAMMQFYKEQGMAPVLGCLPMFLQMPIWIALWSALQSTFELRQSPFLYIHHGGWGMHLTWIRDLANPDGKDTLLSFAPIHIPFFSVTISSLNILPLLLSVVFYFQQKYTPKPITTTPEQAQQQKMMTWMSTLLFPIFLYKGPAGLNLYILTSTAFGIVESKVIRDHIKQREEAEKAGRVFVGTKPTRAARRKEERDEPPKKRTGLMGWFTGWVADLQQRAEEIRRQADKGK